MNEVKVINHNDEKLRGRFDGEDFVFPPEVPVCLPLEAAKHIFGLGNEDKAQALNALGWYVPGGLTLKQSLDKLDNISFLTGRTVFEDEDVKLADDDAPAPPRARTKTGGRPHVASSPGGESEAGDQGSASANP
jgi:hypothetical protein